MEGIPVLGFAAWSGTGKTTVMERTIAALRRRGLRVAAVKHDGHDFEMDRPGKDSWRFAQAGACRVVVGSESRTALVEGRGRTLPELLELAGEADIILVEGYKAGGFSQIGVCRRETGKGLPLPPEEYVAVVADGGGPWPVPRFGYDQIEELTDHIMEHRNELTHFDARGRARMVDVGDKEPTRRTAVAAVRVLVNDETFRLIQTGGMKKGDVLTVAQIAGVMGAKRTPKLIPMCHPILMDGVDMELTLNEERRSVEIRAAVTCQGRTGVEMEALTAASAAALTVYDMCKAVQRDMVVTDLRLVRKTGGVHGDLTREGELS